MAGVGDGVLWEGYDMVECVLTLVMKTIFGA